MCDRDAYHGTSGCHVFGGARIFCYMRPNENPHSASWRPANIRERSMQDPFVRSPHT
ncbi:hypothetical protein C8R41DRAFT_833300 [Lentinula lateritia]|uniref:Uncharacterized protein n=1 Tax=Lentinula lateritia TaxID=40482 RepID=A0ABQ8VEX2_9AGAR|nr:hypothetical protein C8R41DRAFT_833300 [Lentinula lateritia]